MNCGILLSQLANNCKKYKFGIRHYDYAIILNTENEAHIYNLLMKYNKEFAMLNKRNLTVFNVKTELSPEWRQFFERHSIIRHEMEYDKITIYVSKHKQHNLILLSNPEPFSNSLPIRRHASVRFIYKNYTILVKDRNYNKFIIPSGSAMIGENAEDCIIREIKEELGITIQPANLRYDKTARITIKSKIFDTKYLDEYNTYTMEVGSDFVDSLRLTNGVKYLPKGEISYIWLIDVRDVNKFSKVYGFGIKKNVIHYFAQIRNVL
jgi:8-oxo-dGTP pyrophosphatase MutT (NUDIX family)